MGGSSVLGALCDIAHLRKPDAKFERIIRHCRPASEVQPFFRRAARSRLALAQTRANALDVFRRWNSMCVRLRPGELDDTLAVGKYIYVDVDEDGAP